MFSVQLSEMLQKYTAVILANSNTYKILKNTNVHNKTIIDQDQQKHQDKKLQRTQPK